MKQLIIHGVTESGQRFRPSDWAERLAGVMAQFKPPGFMASHIAYSPYVVPNIIDGVKCVVVDGALQQAEPAGWNFLLKFAEDNHLQISEH